MKPQRLLSLLVTWAALIYFSVAAHACAVCLTGAGDGTADAFNWSVLFLMTAPYLVVGSIGGWLFYSYRRAASKLEAIEKAEPLVHLAWNQEENINE